jgi:hypothetical protein
LIERSKPMSGESLRAMIVRVASSRTWVSGFGRSSSSGRSQPSSIRSRLAGS